MTLATHAKVVDIPLLRLRIIITESPGKNPSEFQVDIRGKYILVPLLVPDMKVTIPITDLAHSGRAWGLSFPPIVLRVPPILPHLSAQPGGGEDMENLKRLLREGWAHLNMEMRRHLASSLVTQRGWSRCPVDCCLGWLVLGSVKGGPTWQLDAPL